MKLKMIKNKSKLAIKLFIIVWVVLAVHIALKLTFNYWQPYVISNDKLQAISDFIDANRWIEIILNYIWYMISGLLLILAGLRYWKFKNKNQFIIVLSLISISFVLLAFFKITAINTLFITIILPIGISIILLISVILNVEVMIDLNIDYKLIGKRIKEARKEAGLTQEKMAEILDVSIGYVSQVERGTTKISLDLLGAVSSILKKDLSYFVSEAVVLSENYMTTEILEDFEKLSARDKQLTSEFIKLLIKY
jgi:transcriptional regulator with XRE-family HTH domain